MFELEVPPRKKLSERGGSSSREPPPPRPGAAFWTKNGLFFPEEEPPEIKWRTEESRAETGHEVSSSFMQKGGRFCKNKRCPVFIFSSGAASSAAPLLVFIHYKTQKKVGI